MSDVNAEAVITGAVNTVVLGTERLSEVDFARLVGKVMCNMTFTKHTVLAMVRALHPQDFKDFCDMVPAACNQVCKERG